MSDHVAFVGVPLLVARAEVNGVRAGFNRSCLPETGRLLRVLVSAVRNGTIAEIGAGCGVGAAWIASALVPGVSLVTVEQDAERAGAAQELFTCQPSVRVIAGDWRTVLAFGPFALIFVDVTDVKNNAETVIAALASGGTAVLNDLTPLYQWPEEWQRKPDPVREAWLHHPNVVATEILVTPSSAVVLATRLPD